MPEIIISKDFKLDDFKNHLDSKEITLAFLINATDPAFEIFKEWKFLKKFKKLKTLILKWPILEDNATGNMSYNFFVNLYSLSKLEKLIFESPDSFRAPKKNLPKNLYPKNLKEFKFDFAKGYFDTLKEKDRSHQGIGDENTFNIDDYELFHENLLQMYDFPNIQKFKNLETLNFYNFYYPDTFLGNLFELDNSIFYKKIDILKAVLKKTKVKKINIIGINLKDEFLYDRNKAIDDDTGKTFIWFDSEIFKSIAELYSVKKILFNNEDPLKYLKKYFLAKDFKTVLNLARTSGIPKNCKSYTVGNEGQIQLKFKQ